ncbi:unnamed protein product [Closterium sp. NIES-65]|nr:unnamed protein product [Closterium sp. NIES-65]
MATEIRGPGCGREERPAGVGGRGRGTAGVGGGEGGQRATRAGRRGEAAPWEHTMGGGEEKGGGKTEVCARAGGEGTKGKGGKGLKRKGGKWGGSGW